MGFPNCGRYATTSYHTAVYILVRYSSELMINRIRPSVSGFRSIDLWEFEIYPGLRRDQDH